MAIYPDITSGIPSHIPFESFTDQRVIKTQFESGIEQRRLVWASPRRDIVLTYPALRKSSVLTLYSFYEQQKGSFLPFIFFFPHTFTYQQEYIGVHDGRSSSIMNLPSKNAVNYELYVDGILQDEFFYNFTPSGGPDTQDILEVLFSGELLKGFIFTWSFSGRLAIKARFFEDGIKIIDVKDYYYSLTVKLKGLQYAMF